MVTQADPFLQRLRDARVVAILRSPSADAAVAISHALVEAGLTAIEITFSTPDAARAMARVRAAMPAVLLGAGTVLGPAEIDAACGAGAEFLVSPHFDPGLMATARDRGVPLIPGALTPSEIVAAHQAGAPCVKLFPASLVGPGYLKALSAPLPHIPLMPTGGIHPDNLAQWLEAGGIAVGMGGALTAGDLEQVRATARRVNAVLDAVRRRKP